MSHSLSQVHPNQSKFIRYSPNEIDRIIEDEKKLRRNERIKQVRNQEKKRAEDLRKKYEQKKTNAQLTDDLELKFAQLERAKQELQELQNMRASVLESGQRTSAIPDHLTQQQNQSMSSTRTGTGPIETDAHEAIPNTAFGLGFYRCEEVREASQIQDFVKNYTEEKRDKERKQRYKVAYNEEIGLEAAKAREKRVNDIKKQTQIDVMNHQRRAKMKTMSQKRAPPGSLGKDADTIVMCQDKDGYVDFSQTRFHVIDNTDDLENQLQ